MFTTAQKNPTPSLAPSTPSIAQPATESLHIDQSPAATAQRKREAQLDASPLQRKLAQRASKLEEEDELLQGKFEAAQRKKPEEEELLQGRFARITGSAQPIHRKVAPTTTVAGVPINDDPSLEHEADVMGAKAAQFVVDNRTSTDTVQQEKKPNNTGLPDNLKAGIENLSGMSMDGVKVHYNSAKPAQLNALAYAQGTDIHVGPGQEKHVPHEAWHVVQQHGISTSRGQAVIKKGTAMARNSTLQRKTEIKYQTQEVNYTDESTINHTEHVGKMADAFIDIRDPVVGSAPNEQQKPMYDRLRNVYSETFIRGHLLNDHLGGIGEIYNLFPITYKANSEHKITAEGHLKRHLRAEYDALKIAPNDPSFIHYRVEAVPQDSSDLSKNACSIFRCDMVSAHNGLPGGENETWEIYSTPGSKLTATGPRSGKDDYSNNNLGTFGAQGKGECLDTLKSRMQSTVNGWKGNQDNCFAPGGRIDSFISLSAAKDNFLCEMDKHLSSDTIFEEVHDSLLEQTKNILMNTHDMPGLQNLFDKTKKELTSFELKKKKDHLLDQVTSYLLSIKIPDTTKDLILQAISITINTIKDSGTLQNSLAHIQTYITTKVQQALNPQ